MEHAKYLLYEKSLSVTDVSALLGYSSISHFSAAFKKHTGLKPCKAKFSPPYPVSVMGANTFESVSLMVEAQRRGKISLPVIGSTGLSY